MSASAKGLGKGLEALFSQSSTTNGQKEALEFQNLHVDSLQPNPDQPRKTLSEESLQELAQSIKHQGLLQPILACRAANGSKYQIVAGERRWRAAKIAGLSQVPVILANLDPSQSMLLGLIENLQREDLNAMEAALAMSQLQNSLQLSQAQLAEKLGKSRSAVANTLRLLHLEEEIQTAIKSGEFSPGQARALLAVEDIKLRLKLFHISLQHELSAREIEKAAAFCKQHGHLPQDLSEKENKPGSAASSKNPEFLKYKKELQKQFHQLYPTRVRISGAEDKGRITFQYTSQQELQELLRLLGMPEELVSRETGT